MATVIDALVITLGLDPKGVQQGMSEAERNVSGGMNKITNIIRLRVRLPSESCSIRG